MAEGKVFLDKFNDVLQRRAQALEGLLPMLKNIVYILKDAGQPSSARELEAQLFVITTMDEEIKQLVVSDPKGMCAAVLEVLRKGEQR